MMKVITVYIGLGSNINQPIAQIKTALVAISHLSGTTLLVTSSLYQTAPVGFLDQPDFINAVCAIATALPPHDLLHQLQRIERRQGRLRNGQKNHPRSLDLDLLLYDNLTLQTDELIIPHPRLSERGFVVIPLAEIAPELQLPDGQYISELLQSFSTDTGVMPCKG